MCDLDPTCPEVDAPLAVALWCSDRPALVTVVCPWEGHRLAAVYYIEGSRKLCRPAIEWLEGEAATRHHQHARLDDPGFSSGHHHGFITRCRCGTHVAYERDVDASQPEWRARHRADKNGRLVVYAESLDMRTWVGPDSPARHVYDPDDTPT